MAAKASMGTAAACSLGSPPVCGAATQPDSGFGQVPTRIFGNTGIQVSALALGGSQNLSSKQLLLRQALKWGVTYWDTAYIYAGGKSEEGIGKYFSSFPEDRQRVFLTTKAPSSQPERMSRYLRKSLERLKTDYVDLFLMHKLSNLDKIDLKAVKAWAEKAKKKGLIRLFGFSTHKNMANCLLQGASLGWIDGILTSYNYRLMESSEMQNAVEACYKAGIGLTAMKTQAPFLANFYAEIGRENETATAYTEPFIDKGFTHHQAKLKAVWENAQIASICSHMPNMTILQANVAASTGKAPLSRTDKDLLKAYAQATSHGYCMGCAQRCESIAGLRVPVSDVLRCLMYHFGYDDFTKAQSTFERLRRTRSFSLAHSEYHEAERRCPHKIPIAALMHTAANLFETG